jgi:hypothetical protein
MKLVPKLRYCIVEILGDYYYKELPMEQALEITVKRIPKEEWFKNDDDINRYMEKHLNVPIPINEPQWMLLFQEEYQRPDQCLYIWKSHHSFGDGVSQISFHLANGDKYDITNMIPIKKVPFVQRMILRLGFLLYLPRLLGGSLVAKCDRNPLHDGKRELTGVKKAACSGDILFKEVKETSKRMKLTINDMMMSCLSATMKEYFKSVGDTKTD